MSFSSLRWLFSLYLTANSIISQFFSFLSRMLKLCQLYKSSHHLIEFYAYPVLSHSDSKASSRSILSAVPELLRGVRVTSLRSEESGV